MEESILRIVIVAVTAIVTGGSTLFPSRSRFRRTSHPATATPTEDAVAPLPFREGDILTFDEHPKLETQ
jgi:hypothetical protein